MASCRSFFGLAVIGRGRHFYGLYAEKAQFIDQINTRPRRRHAIGVEFVGQET